MAPTSRSSRSGATTPAPSTRPRPGRSTRSASSPDGGATPMTALFRRSRLRPALVLVGAVALGAVLAGCASRPGSGPTLDWNYFFDSILRPDGQIQYGLWLTVVIAVVSQVIGVILGTFAALGKMARLRPVRWIANIYIWFFRGTPLIVQIVFFFFGLSVARIYGWPALD